MEHIERVEGHLPERQVKNQDVAMIYVPCALDRGPHKPHYQQVADSPSLEYTGRLDLKVGPQTRKSYNLQTLEAYNLKILEP